MKEFATFLLVISFYGGIPIVFGFLGHHATVKKGGDFINRYFILQICGFVYIMVSFWIYFQHRRVTSLEPLTDWYILFIILEVFAFWLWEKITERI